MAVSRLTRAAALTATVITGFSLFGIGSAQAGAMRRTDFSTGTLSDDAVAALRAQLDPEPRPVVTDEMRALLAEKDADALAYQKLKLTRVQQRVKFGDTDLAPQGVAVQAVPLRTCPDGDCSWNIHTGNQTAQITSYYCGPATLVEAVGHRGVAISQSTAGSRLGTTTDGTAWYNGSYPMANALTYYLSPQGAKYVAVNLAGSPSSTEKTTYQNRVVADIDRGWGIAGNAYEATGGNHLVGHPNKVIFHWFEIRGYDSWGANTYYEDSVAGASSVSWSAGVPPYSTYNSNNLVGIMGGRGYVW